MQGSGAKVSLYPPARFVRASWSPPSDGAPRKLPVGLMDVCLSLATHQLSHLPLFTVGCNLLSPKPSISPCSCLGPPGALRIALPLIHLDAVASFVFSSLFLHLCPTPAACFIPLSRSCFCIRRQTYHENSGGEPKYPYFSKRSRLTFLCSQSL